MVPGHRSAGYRFVRLLGRGSRAMVWEVLHENTSRRMAIKILDTLEPEERQRLAAEYEAMSRLDHPNVVGVHALLEVEGRMALVLDYVQGSDLESYLSTHTPDQALALDLFGGILRGLVEAHAFGMVHRDLKPGNVLLTPDDPPLPRIADFGIVKADGNLAITVSNGLILGTVRYMAPEQLKNPAGVDGRADLFSAGCILFELLCHQKAFDAPNKIALMNAVRLKRHAPFPEDLPVELQDLLSELLDPDPDKRPPSAIAVLKRLGLPLEPPEALPSRILVEVRSRLAFYTAIGGVVLLAIGLVGYGIGRLVAG